ncbi:hypothetical protein [Celeribacter baekdonensis]|uniref:hypothetical protein n=1 Tax=Celeribacter baekdonensis TaxID=875171 RepID=UPI003A8CBB93
MKQPLRRLDAADDIQFQPPLCQSNSFDIFDGFSLPSFHASVLSDADGISAFGGYFRLFGINDKVGPNLSEWNSPEYWKFSWRGRADDFLCFGTTGWGDQYAYHIGTLARGNEAPVFLLDAFTMEAEHISRSFETFWENDFVRNAIAPYDDVTVKARKALGMLDWNELAVFTPPLQLGGTESTSEFQKMTARAAMIVNGDITSQIDALGDEHEILRLEQYSDDLNRPRMRILTR